MYEIKNYSERDELLKDCELIGYFHDNSAEYPICDIWLIELYKNKEGKYFAIITRDSDESWFLCDFENMQERT